MRAIAARGVSFVLLNLGADPPCLTDIPSTVTVISPGRLEAGALAECLSAADVYLAPFADGVSSRRTTLMAALQHGLAVVGTDGPMTDQAMRAAHDALTLTPVSDAEAFAEATANLALDRPRRDSQAAAGRVLYEQAHDLPVACRVALENLRVTHR
jgi:glycosyltransferase involved in cell wall biosynthesis